MVLQTVSTSASWPHRRAGPRCQATLHYPWTHCQSSREQIARTCSYPDNARLHRDVDGRRTRTCSRMGSLLPASRGRGHTRSRPPAHRIPSMHQRSTPSIPRKNRRCTTYVIADTTGREDRRARPPEPRWSGEGGEAASRSARHDVQTQAHVAIGAHRHPTAQQRAIVTCTAEAPPCRVGNDLILRYAYTECIHVAVVCELPHAAAGHRYAANATMRTVAERRQGRYGKKTGWGGASAATSVRRQNLVRRASEAARPLAPEAPSCVRALAGRCRSYTQSCNTQHAALCAPRTNGDWDEGWGNGDADRGTYDDRSRPGRTDASEQARWELQMAQIGMRCGHSCQEVRMEVRRGPRCTERTPRPARN